MRLLVTGNGGFIGRHVIRALDSPGVVHDAIGVDRLFDRECDLRAWRPWVVRVREHNPDGVIHLAAHADVRDNWTATRRNAVWDDNLESLRNLLDVAADHVAAVRSFVFVSTGAVYAGNTGPVLEASPVVATSPYAASKLAGEAFVQAYAHRFGWRWYVLRPAACFGMGYHHGHVADFVRQMKERGRIEALDDGMTPRPALHVRDLAEACVALATGNAPSGVYNAASGLWTWRKTIRVMSEMAGREVPFTACDRKNGWIGDQQGAVWSSHLLEHVGIPMRRKIEDGVRDALSSCGWPL